MDEFSFGAPEPMPDAPAADSESQTAPAGDDLRTCAYCGESFDAALPGAKCATRPLSDSRCCPHAECHATSSLPERHA